MQLTTGRSVPGARSGPGAPQAPPSGADADRTSRRRRGRPLILGVAVAATVIGLGVTGLAPGATDFGRPAIAAVLATLGVAAAALAVTAEVDRRTLERELRDARLGAAEAGARERRRIQRDLHDSAQQRLIAVRIRLGLLARRPELGSDSDAIEQLGHEVDEALAELRSIARDGSPSSLDRLGVPAALAAATLSAPGPVSVEAEGWGRYDAQLERTVYFCCVEALQNVWKHAGSGARPRVRLHATRAAIAFDVEDSGRGFDLAQVGPGEGLHNIANRVEAVRGRASIESVPGAGTRISGRIPINPAA